MVTSQAIWSTASLFLIPLLLMGGLFAGAIVLQVALCKKEARWPGLILPAIAFLAALFTSFGLMTYSIVTGEAVSFVEEGGRAVEERVDDTRRATSPGTIAAMGYTFALYNVPTVVFLAIYGAYRGKHRRRKALERIGAQDLE